MRATAGRLLVLTFAALALAGVRWDGTAQECSVPCVGPQRGALFAAGGGDLPFRLYRRFVNLAGGTNARIVLIPTAETETGIPDASVVASALRRAGAQTLTILHTRDRNVANDPAFVIPLKAATGVWISGGRQYRLVDAYLGTLTQKEIGHVLDRGGVVGGSSAGASILGSFLLRGAPVGNQMIVAPGYDTGFGFLRGVAIDQHLLARGREYDLLQVLKSHPLLLGIGIDEGTAAVIIGDRLQVIGSGKAVVYNTFSKQPMPAYWLSEGDIYDLGARRILSLADGEQ